VLALLSDLTAGAAILAVLLGRSISLAAAPVPFMAGASRMPYPAFLAYDAAGVVIWGVGFSFLGYGLGASWKVAERWIGWGSLLLVGVLIGAFVVEMVAPSPARGAKIARLSQ
jgi:undecaprenyl-diphosphatase